MQVFNESGALVISDEALDKDPDQEEAQTAPQAETGAGPELDDLKQKFTALVRQVKEAIKQDPGRKETLSAQASAIGKLLEQGDAARARGAMVQLLDAVKQGGGAEHAAAEGGAKGTGAAIKKLLTLRTETEAGYARLLAEMAKHDDARVRRIASDGHQKLFGGAGGLLDGLDAELFDAVKAWGSASGEDRRQAAQAIKRCADRLSGHLPGNTFISLMETIPLACRCRSPNLCKLS